MGNLQLLKAFRVQFRKVRNKASSCIDLLNYMHNMKIPQGFTLIRNVCNLCANALINKKDNESALFCQKYADWEKKKIPEMFNFQGFTKFEVF